MAAKKYPMQKDPAPIRVPNLLLSVCRIGLRDNDPATVVEFAEIVQYLEDRLQRAKEADARTRRATDKPEASAVAGARR